MVVINKGRGIGFVKCGCGYAHAATSRQQQTSPHKNPYTDRECQLPPLDGSSTSLIPFTAMFCKSAVFRVFVLPSFQETTRMNGGLPAKILRALPVKRFALPRAKY